MKLKKIYLLYLLLGMCVLSGCDRLTELDVIDEPELLPVNQTAQAAITPDTNKEYDKDYVLKIRMNSLELEKYEPETGCYVGADITEDKIVAGKIPEFEIKTGKRHAIYSCSMLAGGEFPERWFLECIANMKTPSITINPLNQYNIYDMELLRKTAGEIGAFNIPVFVNLYPYSKDAGYAAKDYVDFYKRAKEIFRELAPNAALVWSVYFEDAYDCGSFYPGDDCVDWVGINVVLDVVGDGEYKDALKYINYFYYNYQTVKPVMLSELRVSHFTTENNAYYTEQAANEIEKIYTAVLKNYPRLKAVLYMDMNNVDLAKGGIASDYSVISDDSLKNSYSESVSNPFFLSDAEPLQGGTANVIISSPFSAYFKDNEYYIAHKTLEYDLRLTDMHLLSGKDIIIEGEKYYSMADINGYRQIDFFVDNDAESMVIQIKK